jgi:hypothetical protein
MHKIFQTSTISSVFFIKDRNDELLHLQNGVFSWLTATGAKNSLQAHFKRITVKERTSLDRTDLLNCGFVVKCYDGKLHYIIEETEYKFYNYQELVAKLFDMETFEIVQIGE